jgi:hypothetical protein
MKSALNTDDYIAVCDLAENYSFVLQDEVHSFHWDNVQATIYPSAIYL